MPSPPAAVTSRASASTSAAVRDAQRTRQPFRPKSSATTRPSWRTPTIRSVSLTEAAGSAQRVAETLQTLESLVHELLGRLGGLLGGALDLEELRLELCPLVLRVHAGEVDLDLELVAQGPQQIRTLLQLVLQIELVGHGRSLLDES